MTIIFFYLYSIENTNLQTTLYLNYYNNNVYNLKYSLHYTIKDNKRFHDDLYMIYSFTVGFNIKYNESW